MENAKPKIIAICGPTASGKSDVAIRLAKAINGEVVSADSRQIFRGLDIGSGKVPGTFDVGLGTFDSEGIPHHLIDVADPMEDFNVSHFKKEAEKAITNIIERGKIPIICGGTGFWIDSLVNNTALPDVKPDPVLRSMLRNKSAEELFKQLKKLDSVRARNIEVKNKVRLIRAIEICKAIGKVPEIQDTKYGIQNTKYEILQIGLSVPKEILDEKIKKRLVDRFGVGMIEEVENLHKNGVSWEWLERIGLEYRWIARYLQKKVSLEEMQEKLYFDSIHYAKRQMTWLKRNKNISWLADYSEIEKAVNKFLG